MTAPNLAPDQNFWNAVDEEAEKGGGGAQFGQLGIKPSRYIHWVNKEAIDVTPEIFNALPSDQKSLELLFTVDVKGMNPDLEWMYERRLLPGSKNWHKILKPSVVAMLGEDSMSKGNYSVTLQGLVGKYVEVADVADTKNPEFNTIKFVRVFASKDECFAAYSERFGGAGGSDGGAAVPASAPLSHPSNYEAPAWEAMVPSIKKALETQSVPDIAEQYQVAPNFIAEIAGRV